MFSVKQKTPQSSSNFPTLIREFPFFINRHRMPFPLRHPGASAHVGIWAAETHLKTVVSMETLEEFGFMDAVTHAPAYARGIIEDQQTRYASQILEDVL